MIRKSRQAKFPAARRGQPVVIRQVVWFDPTGRPKIARDRKANLELERVTAKTDRSCAYHACALGPIAAGTEYAKATDKERADGPFIRGRNLPTVKDFHFECVWPEARPLVRFLRTTPPEEGAS